MTFDELMAEVNEGLPDGWEAKWDSEAEAIYYELYNNPKTGTMKRPTVSRPREESKRLEAKRQRRKAKRREDINYDKKLKEYKSGANVNPFTYLWNGVCRVVFHVPGRIDRDFGSTKRASDDLMEYQTRVRRGLRRLRKKKKM